MLRYLSIVWNAQDAEQAETAKTVIDRAHAGLEGWSTLSRDNGFFLVCRDHGPTNAAVVNKASDGSKVALLGAVFERADTPTDEYREPAQVRLTPELARAISGSQGDLLLRKCWGSYVALIRDASNSRCWILRSPHGALPCLCVTYRRVKIYFSFLPDLAALQLVTLSINWTFVARMFLKLMQSHATGCNEVSEVLCGERIELDRTLAERRMKFWNPLEVIQARRIDDPMRAAAAVRNVTRTCIHAWASLHPNIVHLLSGGLDSSIVLSCLNDARTAGTITCINRYSPGADGDERFYARLVASATGQRLVEAQRSADFKIDELCNVRLSERPQGYLALLGQSHNEMQLAREVGASAIFGGRFGDQVFFSSDLALSGADYVSDVGLRPGLIPVASSAARAANSSFWRVMKLALNKGMVRSSVNPNIPVLRPNSLVNAPVLLRLQDLHAEDLPYSDSARNADSSCYIPPGKQLHVLSVATPDGYYVPNYSEADAQYVSPLLSQPLVELCLQIPTYVLTSGGWDRAVARNAFARDLPAEIIRRRSKGGQAQHTAEIFQRHRAFLRDLLLNGELVRADILDRERVAEAFAKGSSNLFHGPARLSRFVNMELWLAIFRQHTVQQHGFRDAAIRRAS